MRLARLENRELETERIPICDLYQSFRSRGLVYVGQVAMAKEDQDVDDHDNLMYPCGPHEELHNWKIQEFPVVFNSLSKFENNHLENNNVDVPCYNFDHPIYQADEGDDDLETPPELKRLMEQEDRIIQPHEEEIEMINLGDENDKKEIKVGTAIKGNVRDQLLKLLFDYVDIFAWTYQDMPGLDPSIVEHKLPLKPDCPPVKQKLRRMKPEVSLKIKEEVKK